MDKAKLTTPVEWTIRNLTQERNDNFRSIHFDYLRYYRKENPKGLNLLKYAFLVLREVHAVAQDILNKSPQIKFHPMIYFPLGDSPNIMNWNNAYWEELGKDNEPPSLYLFPTKQIFEDYVEEYRKPIDIPVEEQKELLAIFRCCRDLRSMENSWEFSIGIYLYSAEDF